MVYGWCDCACIGLCMIAVHYSVRHALHQQFQFAYFIPLNSYMLKSSEQWIEDSAVEPLNRLIHFIKYIIGRCCLQTINEGESIDKDFFLGKSTNWSLKELTIHATYQMERNWIIVSCDRLQKSSPITTIVAQWHLFVNENIFMMTWWWERIVLVYGTTHIWL